MKSVSLPLELMNQQKSGKCFDTSIGALKVDNKMSMTAATCGAASDFFPAHCGGQRKRRTSYIHQEKTEHYCLLWSSSDVRKEPD